MLLVLAACALARRTPLGAVLEGTWSVAKPPPFSLAATVDVAFSADADAYVATLHPPPPGADPTYRLDVDERAVAVYGAGSELLTALAPQRVQGALVARAVVRRADAAFDVLAILHNAPRPALQLSLFNATAPTAPHATYYASKLAGAPPPASALRAYLLPLLWTALIRRRPCPDAQSSSGSAAPSPPAAPSRNSLSYVLQDLAPLELAERQLDLARLVVERRDRALDRVDRGLERVDEAAVLLELPVCASVAAAPTALHDEVDRRKAPLRRRVDRRDARQRRAVERRVEADVLLGRCASVASRRPASSASVSAARSRTNRSERSPRTSVGARSICEPSANQPNDAYAGARVCARNASPRSRTSSGVAA